MRENHRQIIGFHKKRIEEMVEKKNSQNFFKILEITNENSIVK